MIHGMLMGMMVLEESIAESGEDSAIVLFLSTPPQTKQLVFRRAFLLASAGAGAGTIPFAGDVMPPKPAAPPRGSCTTLSTFEELTPWRTARPFTVVIYGALGSQAQLFSWGDAGQGGPRKTTKGP